jgi:conjugal transfer pilus assembly protein TraF
MAMQVNKMAIALSILCSQIACSTDAYAFKFTSKICQEYGLGTNWYCKKDEEKATDVTANDILESPLPSEEKAVQLNALWEKQRKIAVISGKKEDLEQFLITHWLIAEKGVDFARNIQHLISTNPQYSNSQSYYKNISDEAIRESEKQVILRSSNKRYGLVFVYDSSCPHCIRQLPIIRRLKTDYKFSILGISLDENYLEGLDENITDESILQDPNVQSVPTVLLLDKQNPAKIFISKGLTTLDELEERIAGRIMEVENAKDS